MVAAMIMSKDSLFLSSRFSVVPHERFRGESEQLNDMMDNQTLGDVTTGRRVIHSDRTLRLGYKKGRVELE